MVDEGLKLCTVRFSDLLVMLLLYCLRHVVVVEVREANRDLSREESHRNAQTSKSGAGVSNEVKTSQDVEFDVPLKGFVYDPRKLKTRITSSSLCEILDMLCDTQRLVICEMGFVGFLKVSCNKLPTVLPLWLMHHFDTKSCSIRFVNVVEHVEKELPITEDDVHLCLGLPQGLKKIVLPDSNFDNTDGFHDFSIVW